MDGSWLSSLIKSAGQVIQRDLGEFVSTVTQDTSTVVQSTAEAVTAIISSDALAEECSAEGGARPSEEEAGREAASGDTGSAAAAAMPAELSAIQRLQARLESGEGEDEGDLGWGDEEEEKLAVVEAEAEQGKPPTAAEGEEVKGE